MWDSIWINGRIATMKAGKDGLGIIESGAVAVKDGIVAWTGTMTELPGSAENLAAKVHSAEGCWITPGLMDCHSHLVYAGNRSRDFEMRLRGASRMDIQEAGGGILYTVNLTRAATEDQLLAESERRLLSLVSEGVTTVEIKSGYGLDLQTELKLLEVASRLEQRLAVKVCKTFGIYAFGPEYSTHKDMYVNFLCDTVLPDVESKGLATAVDVQVDEMGFSRDQAARIFETARKLNLSIHAHTDELSDFGGAAFAAGHGALTVDHLEHVSEEGVAAMAKAGSVAVLLPGTSYTTRASRTPPVNLFRKYSVPMAVATNCNPGPSPATSILLMLNMACILFGMTPEEALLGVTRNASLALGLGKTHGTLEDGKAADFVLWNIDRPADLAYNMGLNPCVQVVRSGETVQNGNSRST